MHFLSLLQKRVAAWLCLAMMLFAQGAYAMQACVAVEVAVEAAMEEMPCHQQQEKGGKNLCQNHCLASQQTLDAGKLPVVAPAAVPVLLLPVAATDVTRSASPYSAVPTHPGAPPIAVLHCCFRV